MRVPLAACQIFSEGLDHPECVAVAPDGSVWAGGEAGQIYRVPPEGGEPKVMFSTGGFVLGLAFSADGRWLAACDVKHKVVWRWDLRFNSPDVLAEGFTTPNHLAYDSKGNLYISDSGTRGSVSGRIYKVDAAGHVGVWHEGPFQFANGVALSPSEDALFVCCTWLPGVERISIQADGSAGARSVFAKLPRSLPDGLVFLKDGSLLVSCYAPSRIWLLGKTQRPIVFIEDWECHTLSNPTNLAIRENDLFVANLGRWHITRVPLGN